MGNDDTLRLTLGERMLSAVTGSLLTSLTLTPMDVVRVRLQQQGMLPDCTCEVAIPSKDGLVSNVSKSTDLHSVKSSKLNVPKLGFPKSNKLFWENPCFQELNCVSSSLRFTGTLDAFRKITNIEGITTLWRGISLNLLMAVPSNIVYFTGYEHIRDISPLSKNHENLNPLVCGALARILAATSVAPLELTKTKLQSIPRASKSTKSWTMVKDLVEETRQDMQKNGSLRALFKGLNITLWRDVPFSAIYWGTYEFCKKNLWMKNDVANNNSTVIHFVNSFVSGSVSGTLAAIITHPFDVGKTRWQISMITENSQTQSPQHQRNMFKFLGTIVENEGTAALFTGLTARVIKIAPSCAIMISSYEISKKIFGSE
ncbi:similar to Saccharomyces cerevisiae YGR257C MTM1 Mitochondrial protein of the mitochondrial carrier family [Maudiozyma barnettii]|uniref:Similar to Saccharomyces cerevisiae YGR257C MTM1 Mitochondrial protein of the mitochondrial carrier family n=1 Tax=Maudiozyma barnettii TaxID=61262 RepID=A0A8H2VIN3_9SACH|nr:Mtm1p [Kazachstania barnettii]CAB4256131.1 similar to Saccharomyces cerevisiae YGR257C MTM1 Mitochondrial protein of the mitochondrial carrier family [Kazachstania barnettii]CAD1784739.1 similar to Saccharomyces cerevisiae YGR257C MTM1 Mitochondrial protein of the mitochondrial carrier family [Kazachstania barnettii]